MSHILSQVIFWEIEIDSVTNTLMFKNPLTRAPARATVSHVVHVSQVERRVRPRALRALVCSPYVYSSICLTGQEAQLEQS